MIVANVRFVGPVVYRASIFLLLLYTRETNAIVSVAKSVVKATLVKLEGYLQV